MFSGWGRGTGGMFLKRTPEQYGEVEKRMNVSPFYSAWIVKHFYRGNEMAYSREPFFPHRRNRDGSFDSICLDCLLTIASHKAENELVAAEKVHVCKTSLLSSTDPAQIRRDYP